MTRFRLGISPCPNDVYIFSGMILNQVAAEGISFEVDYQDVETLNAGAQAAAYDVVKISYANYALCRKNYALLDSGGALGRGCGPLLLANGAGYAPDQEILIPGEFTTANFLLDFYLQTPAKKRALPFDALYEHLRQTPNAQGVVIHEKRFTYQQDGLTLITDLGEHWEAKTGAPIPLGGIVLHRRHETLRSQIDALIQKSLLWARHNDAEAFALCQKYAQDLSPQVVRAHIDLYVNDFSLALGEEGRAAIAYFFEAQDRFLAAKASPNASE